MNLVEVILDSWARQCNIVRSLGALIDSGTAHATPCEGESSIAFHLCHIHEVRYGWLSQIAPERAKEFGDVFEGDPRNPTPIADLDEIRRQLDLSSRIVGEVVKDLLNQGVERIGPYEHPVLFLQHMVWHEGWHVGIIFLALRRAGHEPQDIWEEKNVWAQWRDEEVW